MQSQLQPSPAAAVPCSLVWDAAEHSRWPHGRPWPGSLAQRFICSAFCANIYGLKCARRSGDDLFRATQRLQHPSPGLRPPIVRQLFSHTLQPALAANARVSPPGRAVRDASDRRAVPAVKETLLSLIAVASFSSHICAYFNPSYCSQPDHRQKPRRARLCASAGEREAAQRERAAGALAATWWLSAWRRQRRRPRGFRSSLQVPATGDSSPRGCSVAPPGVPSRGRAAVGPNAQHGFSASCFSPPAPAARAAPSAAVPTTAELHLPRCPLLRHSRCHRRCPWPGVLPGSLEPHCQDTATRSSAVLDLIRSAPQR